MSRKTEEPFEKVLEWFDSQVSMEGFIFFRLFRRFPQTFARGSEKKNFWRQKPDR
jgi:hypothetical protein